MASIGIETRKTYPADCRKMASIGNETRREKTYPADCRKIVAIDSHNHDWD